MPTAGRLDCTLFVFFTFLSGKDQTDAAKMLAQLAVISPTTAHLLTNLCHTANDRRFSTERQPYRRNVYGILLMASLPFHLMSLCPRKMPGADPAGGPREQSDSRLARLLRQGWGGGTPFNTIQTQHCINILKCCCCK